MGYQVVDFFIEMIFAFAPHLGYFGNGGYSGITRKFERCLRFESISAVRGANFSLFRQETDAKKQTKKEGNEKNEKLKGLRFSITYSLRVVVFGTAGIVSDR